MQIGLYVADLQRFPFFWRPSAMLDFDWSDILPFIHFRGSVFLSLYKTWIKNLFPCPRYIQQNEIQYGGRWHLEFTPVIILNSPDICQCGLHVHIKFGTNRTIYAADLQPFHIFQYISSLSILDLQWSMPKPDIRWEWRAFHTAPVFNAPVNLIVLSRLDRGIAATEMLPLKKRAGSCT